MPFHPYWPERRPLSLSARKEKDWVLAPRFAGVLIVGKRLYVGNLNYSVSSSDLQQLLGEHGAVRSAEVISDRATGQSKGFGFVEMEDDNAAMAAIEALHGSEYKGRTLTVNEAKPRESRPGGGGGGRGGYGGGGGGYGGGRGGRDRDSGYRRSM